MEKLVLLAMADHARDDGTGCYASMSRLAKKTSLTKRGVQKIIRRMESPDTRLVKAGKITRFGTVEYTITLIPGGEQGSLPLSARDTRPANLKTRNSECGSRESLGTVQREPGAARVDNAKHIERCRFTSGENRVQLATLFNQTKNNPRPAPAWVKGEIAEDLYRGIHNEKIAATFFDARHLSLREQLTECVSAAVTSLVTARVARLKVLSADEIEKCALEELLPGLATLGLVTVFEVRRRQTVQAVTRAVISVCVRMLARRATS